MKWLFAKIKSSKNKDKNLRDIHLLLFVFFSFFSLLGYTQSPLSDSLRVAPISYDIQGNNVSFRGEMPPLNQMAGAPKAFYTYFWEFGDGHYSFSKNPTHQYNKKGAHTARLWATNNYDNGKPPTSIPKIIDIMKSYDQATIIDSPFNEQEDLMIKRNREPLPDQELVIITSYKNRLDYTSSGKLYLFYNDVRFKNNNFILQDTRTHYGEKIRATDVIASQLPENDSNTFLATTLTSSFISKRIVQDSTKRKNLPLTLEESKKQYRDYQVIEFYDLKPGEERSFFRTLKTTPEMIKDTSAVVTLRSIYVPDINYDDHTVKETEMEIVTSHDPNKMSSNGWLMNYRFARFKRLQFKVRFQNNGEGPANTIRLEVDTPDMFDKSTLQIKGMYPECPICPKEKEVNYSCLDTLIQPDKITFTFKKIYLPGSQQKNVYEIDSTKGFVKYSMRFKKDFHKKKTKSKTAIFFDKNDPIITNYATTRFIPGISIGAKAGYIFNPERTNDKEYFAGVTLSPFKSYRGYFQAELMVSSASFDALRNYATQSTNAIGIEEIVRFQEENTTNAISMYAVPASYRYNLSNFFAVEAGIQLSLDASRKSTITAAGEGYQLELIQNELREIRNPELDVRTSQEISNSFSNLHTGFFIGANLGTVRIGPSLGVRYVHYFDYDNPQIQCYAIWKF